MTLPHRHKLVACSHVHTSTLSGASNHEAARKILTQSPRFPISMSKQARDFISQVSGAGEITDPGAQSCCAVPGCAVLCCTALSCETRYRDLISLVSGAGGG